MTARDIVMSAAGNSGDSKTYIEDVFSTYLYTGNSSTQTITNGIDLAGKGGMVWIKHRDNYDGYSNSHVLSDTNRGVKKGLFSNNTDGQSTNDYVTAFLNNGFTVGYTGETNETSNRTYASWTFRKAPKFFDVVTYTGDGSLNRTISHNLGGQPGMVVVKRTSSTGSWKVWHIAKANSSRVALSNGLLESTNPFNTTITTGGAYYQGYIYSADSSGFNVRSAGGANNQVNLSGQTYVAYLFAHDTTTDGLIQCGSFTPDGSGNATVNLGWEPQYLLIKRIDSPSSGNWVVLDTMRGFNLSTSYALNPNTTAAEYLFGVGSQIIPTATGFSVSGGLLSAGSPYIYMAIRRGPMRTPTDGTKVFKAVLQTNDLPSASVNVGFATDMSITSYRTVSGGDRVLVDRLRGVPSTTTSGVSELLTSHTTAAAITWNASDGYGWWYPNTTYVGTFSVVGTNDVAIWNFKRAPGFFDVVCYTGTGSARTVNHNLGVAPELMIIKSRNSTGAWNIFASFTSSGYTFGKFDSTWTPSYNNYYSTDPITAAPTSIQLNLGVDFSNQSSTNYVAYLFSSCSGVSKVGTYTGNGSSQTINCGFSSGARFVLVSKWNLQGQSGSGGDWYVWDTARGIVTGNDPHLSLNTTAAEVTSDDTIDPAATGFIVNQVAATNVNVSGATYIYLSIA